MRKVADKTVCPECGEPAEAPGEAITQAEIVGGGIAIAAGQMLLRIGRAIDNLAKRI